MPKRFFLILLASFVFTTLVFFLSSFVMLYWPVFGNPAAWVGPSLVSFFSLSGAGVKKETRFVSKVLQAVAAVGGLPVHLAFFFFAGERVVRPAVVSLGQGFGGQLPDFFASFYSLVVAGSLMGLVPAFFVALATAYLYLPIGARRSL